MHSIIQCGLILGGKSQKGQAVRVPHIRERDVHQSRSGRSSIRSGQTQNRGVQKNNWRIQENTENGCSLKLNQRKGLQLYQTRPNAVIFLTLYLRLPRAVLTPNSHHGRQDPSNPDARTSADHQSERITKYEETRRTHLEETRRAKY